MYVRTPRCIWLEVLGKFTVPDKIVQMQNLLFYFFKRLLHNLNLRPSKFLLEKANENLNKM